MAVLAHGGQGLTLDRFQFNLSTFEVFSWVVSGTKQLTLSFQACERGNKTLTRGSMLAVVSLAVGGGPRR